MEATVRRTKRSSISIRVNGDSSVYVKAPKQFSNQTIISVVKENRGWIEEHINKMDRLRQSGRLDNYIVLDNARVKQLKKEAKAYIPKRVRHFAKILGVTYGNITIREQKSRWGSCSSNGNLSFNCLIMLMSPKTIDYVIVHELCHRKQMNHSKAFWREVENIIPNYKTYINKIKKTGARIIKPSYELIVCFENSEEAGEDGRAV